MPKAAGEKKRTSKADKADKPKRAMSAYMYFANANREKVKSEKPELTFGELGKELGARWKVLSPSDKVPYEESAKKDKERYEREKEAAGTGTKKSKKSE